VPTILTHPVVPLALCIAGGFRRMPPALLVAGGVASTLPDIDVYGRFLGVARDSVYAHRGCTHSLACAFLIACTLTWLVPSLRVIRTRAIAVLWLCVASHGALDAMTRGGEGIAFLWPLSDERYFLPLRHVAVSPIGLENFLRYGGWRVLRSEFLGLWMPIIGAALLLALRRWLKQRSP
jgi:inner membrane protein